MVTLEAPTSLGKVRWILSKKARNLGQMRSFHAWMGGAMKAWARRNFDSEGRLLDGFPAGWPPLAQRSLKQKGSRKNPKARSSQNILVRTGRLRGGFRITLEPDKARVVNVIHYAAKHHQGVGVARRPLLPESRQAERILHPVALKYVEEALQ